MSAIFRIAFLAVFGIFAVAFAHPQYLDPYHYGYPFYPALARFGDYSAKQLVAFRNIPEFLAVSRKEPTKPNGPKPNYPKPAGQGTKPSLEPAKKPTPTNSLPAPSKEWGRAVLY